MSGVGVLCSRLDSVSEAMAVVVVVMVAAVAHDM